MNCPICEFEMEYITAFEGLNCIVDNDVYCPECEIISSIKKKRKRFDDCGLEEALL